LHHLLQAVSTTEGLSHNSSLINKILSAKETKLHINTHRILETFRILSEEIEVDLEGNYIVYLSGVCSTLGSHSSIKIHP